MSGREPVVLDPAAGITTRRIANTEHYILKRPVELVGHNLILDPGAGQGLQLGPGSDVTWCWRDLEGPVRLRGTGANDPAWTRNLGGGPFAAWKFDLDDECWFDYHAPHDMLPRDHPDFLGLFIHTHWKCGGTDVANTAKFQYTYSYAKGFGQEAMNMTGTTITSEQLSAGQWYPMVSETAAFTPASWTEPDGILEVYFKRIANGATDLNETTSPVYIKTVDVHYQSTNVGTKNKAPGFYGG